MVGREGEVFSDRVLHYDTRSLVNKLCSYDNPTHMRRPIHYVQLQYVTILASIKNMLQVSNHQN